MIIGSVRHRGLLRLLEDDDVRFLSPQFAGRVRKILTAVVLAQDMNAFVRYAPRGWHVHRLTGDRQGEWSASVSGNWRITFDEEDGVVYRLNLEDYH